MVATHNGPTFTGRPGADHASESRGPFYRAGPVQCLVSRPADGRSLHIAVPGGFGIRAQGGRQVRMPDEPVINDRVHPIFAFDLPVP